MFRHTDLMNDTHYVDELPGDTDVVIYQFSIGSPVATDGHSIQRLKVANYHNITPMSWWVNGMASSCRSATR